jgi:hypothetical protein
MQWARSTGRVAQLRGLDSAVVVCSLQRRYFEGLLHYHEYRQAMIDNMDY